jgi:hypothetical protein
VGGTTGTSLHRYATELDLGPPAAYARLAANAGRFGFIHRYPWEPWHYELPLAANTLALRVAISRKYRNTGATPAAPGAVCDRLALGAIAS